MRSEVCVCEEFGAFLGVLDLRQNCVVVVNRSLNFNLVLTFCGLDSGV